MSKILSLLYATTVFSVNSFSVEKIYKSLKPPKHGIVYVVAHRGAHKNIPENSIPAYVKAIELGVDFVEVDIRTTKDGQFVSVHNKEIDAYVPGARGLIEEFTLAELKAFDIGNRLGPEWEGTRIPTFKEILELCKGKCGIYLDLKHAHVKPLIEIIKDFDMEGEVLWCLTDSTEMREVSEYCPECILMPDPGGDLDILEIIRRFSPLVVAPVWRDFSKELVDMCHDAGAIVIVDERGKDSWKTALEWGADGIQTDHPQELIEYLEANK